MPAPSPAAEPETGVLRRSRIRLPMQSHVFFFLILGLMFYLTWLIFHDFVIYIIAGVFVAILALPIDKMWERMLPNRVAAVATMTSIFLILTVPVVLLGILMYNDVSNLNQALNEGALDDLADNALSQGWAQSIMDKVYHTHTAEERSAKAHELVDKLQAALEAGLKDLEHKMVAAVPDFLIGTTVVLFVVYYLLTDGEKLYAYIRRAAPLPGRQVDFLMGEARRGLTGVFNGQILISVMQGVVGGIGFLIAGLPNPVLWGALMALAALLPVLGTPMIWVPGGLFLLFTGHIWQGVFLLAWCTVIILVIIDTFLRPVLLGSRADMHPLFVLIGVLGGAAMFGFIGLFLGPLLVGVTISILKVWEKEYLDPAVMGEELMPDLDTAPPPRKA